MRKACLNPFLTLLLSYISATSKCAMKTNHLLLLLFLVLSHSVLLGQNVNYTASQDIITNPERGLQKYSITANNYNQVVGANNLSVSTLENWKNSSDKVTVVFRYFLLSSFLNTDINDIYLDNIQGDFDNIRAAGFKVLVRFSYSDSRSAAPQQPSKAQILTHINQLTPILAANKDVILSHQAGFIGTWGEWYYTNSTEFGTDGVISPIQWNNRKEIIDAMLTATPQGIPLQVRYAQIKYTMYGNTPLTEQTAYQNTPLARIGFYNDAFLNDYGDQGTYSILNQCQDPVGTTDYNYLANETKYLPMTGENNGLNICDNGFRTTGGNAVMEMNLTNWTTINRDYYIPFWDNVISSNNYDEILRRLGYRFSLTSSTLTNNGSNFDLSLTIQNTGFGRVFRERNIYLVLKNVATGDTTNIRINTDIRTWENTFTITQNFSPEVDGIFNLYLWAPDIEDNLQEDADYSIQFANDNIWDATTAFNDLMQTVNLTTALPVQLSYFSVEKHQQTGAALNWATSLELNSHYFDIERSLDGISWTSLVRIATEEDSENERIYSYHDQGATSGIYFYRLKQVDHDGQHTYSDTRMISLNQASSLYAYPNPTEKILHLKGSFSGNEALQIFNSKGEDVLSSIRVLDRNEQLIRLGIHQLQTGLYTIRIGEESVQIIKR